MIPNRNSIFSQRVCFISLTSLNNLKGEGLSSGQHMGLCTVVPGLIPEVSARPPFLTVVLTPREFCRDLPGKVY